MKFLTPCSLALYDTSWDQNGVLVSCGASLQRGELVEIRDLFVKQIDGEQEIVLEVEVGRVWRLVLVREIDKDLAGACSWWKGHALIDIHEDDNRLEGIRQGIRRH